MCKPGGTIDTVKRELNEMDTNVDTLTLVVGDNDRAHRPAMQAIDIVRSYEELVNFACTKSKKVIVSSIFPKLSSSDMTQDQIERVTAGLLDLFFR